MILSVCIVPGSRNKEHAMTFSHLVFVHFLFLSLSSVVLQVLIYFFPLCLCSICLSAMINTGIPWPPSSPPSPLPASQSCLSLHVAAGLLTLRQALTCPVAPVLPAWQHHGEARVGCAAQHMLALEHCSALLGLSHWGRKSLMVLGHDCFLLHREQVLKWLVAYLIIERWQLFTDTSRDFLCYWD